MVKWWHLVLGIAVNVLENEIGLRIVTGIAVCIVLALLYVLMVTFPLFFMVVGLLIVVVGLLYGLGSIIWGIIDA